MTTTHTHARTGYMHTRTHTYARPQHKHYHALLPIPHSPQPRLLYRKQLNHRSTPTLGPTSNRPLVIPFMSAAAARGGGSGTGSAQPPPVTRRLHTRTLAGWLTPRSRTGHTAVNWRARLCPCASVFFLSFFLSYPWSVVSELRGSSSDPPALTRLLSPAGGGRCRCRQGRGGRCWWRRRRWWGGFSGKEGGLRSRQRSASGSPAASHRTATTKITIITWTVCQVTSLPPLPPSSLRRLESAGAPDPSPSPRESTHARTRHGPSSTRTSHAERTRRRHARARGSHTRQYTAASPDGFFFLSLSPSRSRSLSLFPFSVFCLLAGRDDGGGA